MSEPVDMTKGTYRRIYAGFLEGRRINSVSFMAECWFWRMLVIADDYGNLPGRSGRLFALTQGRRENITPATVDSAVRELEQARLIVRYSSDGDDYLHIVGFMDRQKSRNGKHYARYPMHPDEAECVRGNPDETRCIQMKPDETGACITNTNTNTNTKINTNTNTTPAASADAEGPPGFVRFWTAWPRSERKTGKKKCVGIWRRIGLEKHADAVVAAVESWKKTESWTKDGGAFVPMPETWLNGGRWEDVPEPMQAATMKPDQSKNIAAMEAALNRGKR